MNKVNIVSGSARSGTSLMMNILKETFGENRIIGRKWPMEEQISYVTKQGKNESDEEFKIRMYTYDRVHKEDDKKRFDHAKKMNPNGFYEDGRFSVRGLSYGPDTHDIFKKINESEDKKILKIITPGLIKTDPIYIDKIIYMVRHPASIAKSQDDRTSNFEIIEGGKKKNLMEDVQKFSPREFINDMLRISNYVLKNNMDMFILKYEEMLQYPDKVLSQVSDFLSDGDFSKSKNIIDTSLFRNKSHNVPDTEEWNDAIKIFELFLDRKFEDIIKNYTNKHIDKSWYCHRTMSVMVEGHCKSCKNNPKFREVLKKRATDAGIDWGNEPCIYECAYTKGDKFTIEESIKNNFWI